MTISPRLQKKYPNLDDDILLQTKEVFARHATDDTIHVHSVMSHFDENILTATSRIVGLCDVGLLTPTSKSDLSTWSLTKTGRRLRLEHFEQELDRQSVDTKISGLLDRIDIINANHESLHCIAGARLFGSTLHHRDEGYGDIDVEINLILKDRTQSSSRDREHDRNIIITQLQDDDPYLSLFFDYGGIIKLGLPFRQIYSVED